MDDGTTTTGPAPDDDDDDAEDSTTTSASATVSPSTSGSPTSTPVTTPATVSATMTAGPIDGCVDLELVGGPVGSGLTAGSTIGATDDFQFCDAGGGGTGGGASGGDYVVSWIAAASELYNFSLAGSDYDTVLGVFPPECGGVQYECNDDCIGVASSLELYVNAGQQLYIVIDGFQGREGNFVLNIATGRSGCAGGSGSGGGNDSADFISTAGE